MFVGKGETFEIWDPATFADYAARARDIVRENRLSLKSEVGQ